MVIMWYFGERKDNKMKKGFTLIEIIIVLVIVAILACIAIPSFVSYIREGKEEASKNNLLVVEELEQNYYFSNGHYCLTDCDNLTAINKNLNSNIIDNGYIYSCNNTNPKYGYCCTAVNNYDGQIDNLITCGGQPVINNSSKKVEHQTCHGGGCDQDCKVSGQEWDCDGGRCHQTGVAGCIMVCNGGDCDQKGDARFTCNGRPCSN